MPSKYKIVNGLLKPVDDNDNVVSTPQYVPSTISAPDKALTCSYNFNDASSAAQAANTKLSDSTIQALETVQSDDYVNKFGNPNVDGVSLVTQMEAIFTKIQAPIGLASKLTILKDFNIHIKIDDSGSMGGNRWAQAQVRLLEMMDLLQVVPTGPVTLSFLDRAESITIQRYGLTPQQFYQTAAQWINTQFRRSPNGGTPIYRNIVSMLNSARGATAHFILTDGVPTEYETETEIQMIKDLVLGRINPKLNPITFMCCSENPRDTMWMHEVEEIACRPGWNNQPAAPGFVAALQNFDAERLEVLNDQGPWFPYSRSVWLICSIAAALNPNDLDAIDQHAPLSMTTINTFLGRDATMAEYEGYFLQHPNATWLFKEDFQSFVSTPLANQIEAVRFFENNLAMLLNNDINNRNDASEFNDIASTEASLLSQFNRQRPPAIQQARMDFWINHCMQMEIQQLNYLYSYRRVVNQHLWADYVVAARMNDMWQRYVQSFHADYVTSVMQAQGQVQLQNPSQQEQQFQGQPQDAELQPPPPYVSSGVTIEDPQYDQYKASTYYRGSIPSVTAYNQSSSAMYRAPQSRSVAGYQPQYNPPLPPGPCCNML
jgi:hypothetical protein